MRGAAGNGEPHEYAALPAGHDVATGPARLGIQHHARHPRLALDDRAARGGGDLFVRRNESSERGWMDAGGMKRCQNERVHDQSSFHVGNTGTVGASVLDMERTAAGFAVREY